MLFKPTTARILSALATNALTPSVYVALGAGTALRLVVLALSSPEYNLPLWKTYGWPGDHCCYVQWARQTTSPDQGLLSIYTHAPEQDLKVLLSFGEITEKHGNGGIANYPPLAIYLLHVDGLLLRVIDPEQVANTFVARAVFALFPLMGDLILAWGVWRLAGLLFGGSAGRVALTVVYLIPPLWLDSCWWGQTDSWELAPAVWIVVSMVRRRWLPAGVLWGVALALKPQAILLAPVWLFAWAASLTPVWRHGCTHRTRHDWARIILAVLLALVVVNAIALPFWVTTGDAWLQQSYLRNLTQEAPHTTLKAFNIWYIDLLITYDTDVDRTIVGVTKDVWGKILAVVGLLVSCAIAWRGRSAVQHRLVLFAGLWLLAVVMLPTRVHERYILMCLPFLVTAATGARRLWPALTGTIIIACFQMTAFHWLPISADGWSTELKDDTIQYHRNAIAQAPPGYIDLIPTIEQAIEMRFAFFLDAHRSYAPYEWTLTIAALLFAVATFVVGTRLSCDMPG